MIKDPETKGVDISQLPDREVTMSDTLWGERKLVGIVVVVAIVIGAVYTFFVPPVWDARATIYFPLKSPSLLGLSSLGDAGSSLASLTGGPTQIKVFAGLLESEATMDRIQKETGLDRLKLRDMCDIVDKKAENTLTVSVKDKDQNLALKIVKIHLDSLTDLNTKLNGPQAQDDEQVLKREVDLQQSNLDLAEKNLLAFQRKAVTSPMVSAGGEKGDSIVTAPASWLQQLRQLEVSLQAVDSGLEAARSRTEKNSKIPWNVPSDLPPVKKWQSQLTDLEYGLKVKELTYAPTAPEVVSLKKLIVITRKQLTDDVQKYVHAINIQSLDPSAPESTVPKLLADRVDLTSQIAAVKQLAKLAPGEAVELGHLMREVGMKSKILQTVVAEYEMAKMQGERNPDHWEVLDQPRIMEKATNKSYSKNLLIFAFVGFGLAVGAAFVRRYRRMPHLG